MSQEERKQVNVKVPKSMKDRWDSHVDESLEVNSMSDLVRLSVEKEIQGDTGGRRESDSDHLEGISKTLKDIQSNIGQLENRLSRIESSTQEDPQIDKLANDIFPLLPDEKPGTQEWEIGKGEMDSIAVNHGEHSPEELQAGWEGTTESFADIFEVSELDARRALEKLVSDMSGRVRTTEYDGQERYWRDV